MCDALDADGPPPALLAVTAASNVTGWLPPIDDIIEAAHHRGVRVVVDAAQLAPHRPLPADADFLAFSGHKLYAPYGSGALIGPRSLFETGDPFLAGGGAVDLVGLDEVVWNAPPDREEAGSPNVIGAVALAGRHRCHREHRLGAPSPSTSAPWPGAWPRDSGPSRASGSSVPSARRRRTRPMRPDPVETLPVAAFTVEGMHHALVAARLSAEYGIAVRHGCFCAHPYVVRLLGLSDQVVADYRDDVLRGEHRRVPGAVRASAGLGTSGRDVESLVAAVAELAGGAPPRVPYEQDPATGDFFPVTDLPGWRDAATEPGAACSRG